MNTEVIITCAVTGAGDTVGRHPGVPVTPRQVAEAAIEAAKAGAAVAHVHVRDPETGKGSRDPALFREAVERIRDSGTDVVINLTAGMGGDWVPSDEDPSLPGPGTDMIGPAERLVHVEDPDPLRRRSRRHRPRFRPRSLSARRYTATRRWQSHRNRRPSKG